MAEDKKLQAALAGVLYYIQSEQSAGSIEREVPSRSTSPWQLNGRMSIMQMRGLVQRRVLKRI